MIASRSDGILAPSPIAFTPFEINVRADSPLISFCVAHGRAMSQGIVQIPVQPSVKVAFGR
ncbi:hypothetical protein D9M71_708380 [compost metagenome]